MDQAAPDVGRTGPRIPIAREGWPFIIPPLAAAGVLALAGRRRLALAAALAGGACLGFFRDPDRVPPAVAGAVLAPADGRLMAVTDVDDPFVGGAVRLSVFLSPLDVHVNRSPIAGVVRDVIYVPGRFLAAYRPQASDVNESCTVCLEADSVRVSVKQISGVLARRIVCRARPGDTLEAGERYGLIRFGSRTDLVVPRRTTVRVHAGQRVRAGETVMGVLG